MVRFSVPVWPVALKHYTHWKWLDVELALFHHTVVVAPPCTTCRAFDHGHVNCSRSEADIISRRQTLTLDIAAAIVGSMKRLVRFQPTTPLKSMADFFRARREAPAPSAEAEAKPFVQSEPDGPAEYDVEEREKEMNVDAEGDDTSHEGEGAKSNTHQTSTSAPRSRAGGAERSSEAAPYSAGSPTKRSRDPSIHESIAESLAPRLAMSQSESVPNDRPISKPVGKLDISPVVTRSLTRHLSTRRANKRQRCQSARGDQDLDEEMKEQPDLFTQEISEPQRQRGSSKVVTQKSLHDFYNDGITLDSAAGVKTEDKQTGPATSCTSEEDVVILGHTTPSQTTTPTVKAWMEMLGGTLTSVIGNGQCGWTAWYAAYTNNGEPSSNGLKKTFAGQAATSREH